MGVKSMKLKFEGDESKLVRLVTCDTSELLKILENLIMPSKFYGIRPIEDICFFFTNEYK